MLTSVFDELDCNQEALSNPSRMACALTRS